MTNSMTTPLAASTLLMLLAFTAAGCSNDSRRSPPPAGALSIVTNTPVQGANGVPLNASVSATFSETMDPASVTASSFTLTSGAPAVPVAATVILAGSTASVWPAAYLAVDTLYTATITRDALSAAGVGLRTNYVWKFTTGSSVEPGRTVDLGTAGGFAILAKAEVSTVPTSAITGDVGVSPAAASFITGFALNLDPSGVFSTSTQVTGNVYAADYADPTPVNLTRAVHDMQTAFTDAAGRAPGVTELGAGDIGGLTLAPGVYKWSSGLLIPTSVTLSGSATDVWILQIAQNLTVSSAVDVVLAGGALPQNVFWQVSGLVDLGTTAQFNGIILTATAITLRTGASVNGRLFAQTAVSIDGNTVVQPQ